VIERNNLVELEETIQKNLTAFYEVGFALMQIRDNRLYREYKHEDKTPWTFEEYCKSKWNFERNYANKLIKASEVVENLGTNVPIPKSEGSLRPLTSLPPDQQREVYQKAVETAPGGRVAAKHIEKILKEAVELEEPEKKEGKYKYTKTYLVSDAMAFVTMAITQLERIRPNDPKRKEGIQKVVTWCQKHA